MKLGNSGGGDKLRVLEFILTSNDHVKNLMRWLDIDKKT
jgi:hypothetical protein